MRRLKQFFVVTMFVIVASVSVVPAYAANPTTTPSPKPGNGFGDKNHHHTGPPGQSNKPDDHIKANISFIITAEGGVKAVSSFFTTILHTIHFG